MVKSELVQQICNIYSNLKYRDVKMMIDIIFNEIENAMTKGMHCEFREFGTFKVKTREKREARDPKTGKKILVEKKIAPSFKMSSLLRLKLNNIERKSLQNL